MKFIPFILVSALGLSALASETIISTLPLVQSIIEISSDNLPCELEKSPVNVNAITTLMCGVRISQFADELGLPKGYQLLQDSVTDEKGHRTYVSPHKTINNIADHKNKNQDMIYFTIMAGTDEDHQFFGKKDSLETSKIFADAKKGIYKFRLIYQGTELK